MSNKTIRETALRDELEELQDRAREFNLGTPLTNSFAQTSGLILLGIGLNRIAVVQELEDLRRER